MAREALRLLEEAHARHERLDRPRDTGRLMTDGALAQALLEQWDGDEATLHRHEQLITRALGRARRDFGEGSFHDNGFRSGVAYFRWFQGNVEEALRESDAVTPHIKANLGADHRITQEEQSFRLYYAMASGKYERLEELLRDFRIGDLKKLTMGPGASVPVHAEALVLARKGNDRAAESKLRDFLRELRTNDHKFVGAVIANTQLTLAVVLIQAGRADEAVPVMEDAVQTFESTPRPIWHHILAAIFRDYAGMVARAYEDAGMKANAAEWRERARKAGGKQP